MHVRECLRACMVVGGVDSSHARNLFSFVGFQSDFNLIVICAYGFAFLYIYACLCVVDGEWYRSRLDCDACVIGLSQITLCTKMEVSSTCGVRVVWGREERLGCGQCYLCLPINECTVGVCVCV